MIILSSLTSKIFFQHLILIDKLQEFVFYRIEFSFQFINIVLFACFKLFHDFLLGVEFSLNVFTLSHSFVRAGLELLVLLSKDVELSFVGVKFDV
jgi:hypothetical protein